MNIYEKLAAIQGELKAPKNQRNNFGGYNYRSAEDILEAVKPICHKHKAVLTISDEIVQFCDRFYVKATATLFSSEDDGGSVITTAYAREEETKKGMDASQITGSTSSYARKYALNGLFDIDDTKDADTMDNRDSGAPKPAETKKPKPTDAALLREKIKLMVGHLTGGDADKEKMTYLLATKPNAITSLDNIPDDMIADVYGKIKVQYEKRIGG
jgi:hypothetical protein